MRQTLGPCLGATFIPTIQIVHQFLLNASDAQILADGAVNSLTKQRSFSSLLCPVISCYNKIGPKIWQPAIGKEHFVA